MSNATTPPADAVEQFRQRYRTGPDRYINWVHDKLPVDLTAAQRRLLRAVAQHRRVIVKGANGPGKSYAAACLVEAFLNTNRPSTVLATSGTYGKLRRTLCRPVQALHHHDDLPHALPGRYKHSPPRIDTGDPEWFFEAARPKDAGELEGTHNDHLLAITEEADKAAVDRDVIESVDSCLTDANDRHLVIANPPRTENNVAHDLMQAEGWHTVHFATWDSRNVKVDAGEHEGPKIPGLLGLAEVRDSWESWNGEDWPGLDEARTAHQRRDDLDERWYRRRAGVVPPASAGVHRPLDPDLVERGYDPDAEPRTRPETFGVDVARSGDDTVGAGVHGDHLHIHYAARGANHTQQEQELADLIRQWRTPDIAVDAVGEGSGLADGLHDRFGTVHRYKAGAEAAANETYDRCWDESLALFGDYLDAGGTFADRDLYEQAKVAARTVTYDERFIASRGDDGSEVLSATSKDAVRDRLGRSPDHLDAALMAIWARDADRDEGVTPDSGFSLEL